jgi:hypothetical protein
VADGVAVETRGKPAVTLVAQQFARSAELKRQAMGLPTLPLVVIELPLNAEAAKAQARAVADRIAAALLGREV